MSPQTPHDLVSNSISLTWPVLYNDLAHNGNRLKSRDGGCRELIGHVFKLRDLTQTFVLHPKRKLSVAYAAAEFLWYCRGDRDIEMIHQYAPQYDRFAEFGVAHGAYGWRWTNDPVFLRTLGSYLRDREYGQMVGDLPLNTQISAAITLLQRQPNTRQCVITMWNAGDLLHSITGSKGDIPCTLGVQFIRRNDRLHAITYMRSNDIWLGFPYDVFAFTCLQRLIAEAIKCMPGTYTHNVGSMHLYDRNLKPDDLDIFDPATQDHLITDWKWHGRPISQAINNAMELEERMRENRDRVSDDMIDAMCGHGSLMSDLVRCVRTRWFPNEPFNPFSPALKAAHDIQIAKD